MAISIHTTNDLDFKIDTNDWHHEPDSRLAQEALEHLLDQADQRRLAVEHATYLTDDDAETPYLDELGNRALVSVLEGQKYMTWPQTGHNCIAIPV